MFNKIQEFFRNFLLWLYLILTVPTFGILALIIRRHFWACIWCKGFLKILGIEVEIIKNKELPKDIYIFMSNHQSQLDIPVLEKVLEPYNIRFLAKRSLFKIPFFGWGIKALGYVPVEREDPREGLKSILACIERIKKGISIVIFPEGTRSKTGELLPFKLGGFLIPLKSKVPVVAVSIWGTKDILPKGSLWFKVSLRKNVKVYIDEPIETKDFSGKDKEKLAQLVREKILKGLEILKKEEGAK
ncbi:MAG: 1-acyl-sn-glycerol-3-phosphate acyltransferase [Thermodesulfobacterium geofontis]|uniref:1-acyl-sn-glycerol-3-phosphate acyltransferase n=1 Tax=Thermodesulfobacterium geofontis TaxID=1295609 RepID=A0A2N7QCL9_9BACT|nr:MAG: 1-acyl-sn-glycerol-3-phosphate acyltransferase [Thermodesulfobacterium geofontis]PMP96229.1 MAG: 1-acyl-sn-glycerol-3-phosphate acyltransferase [Thermodesulfobacterium geofontis]